jgi:pyridoxine 5-phosphate synthase
MAKLGVNVDHIATLRQVRRATFPDPVIAAGIAELAGADNITCHLREDRRHIQDRDVGILRSTVKTELNLEMAQTQEMLRLAMEFKPHVVTLVPERREELTTEGGLDVSRDSDSLGSSISLLREAGIRVSLFIDPEADAVKLAHRLGAQEIEIHTGRYANAARPSDAERELIRIQEAVQFASKLKINVHAGHGLNYHNIAPLARMENIQSFQIGHAIVAQAAFVGLETAVRQMKALVT